MNPKKYKMIDSTLTYTDIKTGSAISTRILDGFEDSSFNKDQWNQLLESGDTDTVNLTWDWQRSWWQSFGKGKLMLIAAERNGSVIAVAPLFTDQGMIYNLFPEDALDFIGDISDSAVLDAMLKTAHSVVADFVGFRFYFLPHTSRTGKLLMEAAVRLNLNCYDEGSLPSPWLDLKTSPDVALNITRKKSLRRHENYFLREGDLEVLHFTESEKILPHLENFFKQHISRRNSTNASSLFLDSKQCDYYTRLTREISPTGWLRFTRINWNGRPIAFHYGLSYKGRYLYGIPSFDIDLAEHSPGEVLLRQLLLAAISEGATTFDFGMGDELYKYRFSTDVTELHTWGMYP